MSVRVAVVDAGGANLGSVAAALERCGAEVRVTAASREILAADRVVLPGVGAAAEGMRRLREQDLVETVAAVQAPLLGICLGMQLLTDHSAEDGGVDALALIPGGTVPLTPAPGVRVPHMGWNALVDLADDPLLDGIDPGERVYFVHSYAVPVGPSTLASVRHGGAVSAVIRSGLRWGVQFHPERSADVGVRLLANLLKDVDR